MNELRGYTRHKDYGPLFEGLLVKGRYTEIDHAALDAQEPALYYEHPNGQLWIGDATAWLRTLKPDSVDLIFADPPYNIRKAEWDSFESHQAYVEWSLQWIEQAARVLKSTGTLYV